jgi:Ig-like domain from next to BRCA1 gene
MRRRAIVVVVVLILSIMSSCVAAPSATNVPGLEQTLAVRTMVALQGVSYFTTLTPTLTPISLLLDSTVNNSTDSPQALFTLPPTSSPVPSLTPIKVVSKMLQNEDGCANIAEFIKDVTVEDFSQFKPNQLFTKVWEVRNVGTCTWTPNYSLVFTFGDRMSGMSPKYINQTVEPGDSVNLSIDLAAPRDSDIYQGNWMLQDEHGNQFGTGAAGKEFFWVSIMVGSSGFANIFGIGGCGGGG